MKIMTWNCNLNLAKKYEYIENIDADIVIIQECEKLEENYFSGGKFFWTGRIENKGLGVIIKIDGASIDSSLNHNLINFLPIQSDDLRILGVWAYNHRAIKFGNDVSGNTIDAIKYYKDWLVEGSNRCIFGGDLNNSIIWDKRNNGNNFQNIHSSLKDLGFESAYHSLSGDKFGSEREATFYHTKKESKQYHIDYLYTKSLDVKSVSIGYFQDWIKLSDHCPVTIEV
jgi:endonuclease/exonuclease/phosphatase family metal-dependent hydrolase